MKNLTKFLKLIFFKKCNTCFGSKLIETVQKLTRSGFLVKPILNITFLGLSFLRSVEVM